MRGTFLSVGPASRGSTGAARTRRLGPSTVDCRAAADPFAAATRAPDTPATKGSGKRTAAIRERLELSVPRVEYRRGDVVDAAVRPAPDTAPAMLRVGLVCTERYEDRGVEGGTSTRTHTEYEDWKEVVLQGGGSRQVQLRIPPEAPYSYEGTLLSITWRVSARVPRRLRPDVRVDDPIWVDP